MTSENSEKSILIISGTNRPGANALRVARVIEGLYREAGGAAEVLSLAELPREVFDASSYATKPPGMVAIQDRVVKASGLHIVTPEYNGSFPGVLKYFIDMLKFPESFEHKPVAFVGEAAGIWGGIRPVEQLQQIFAYRNAFAYPERVFIPAVGKAFDAEGKLSADYVKRLKSQVEGFVSFVGCLGPHLQRVREQSAMSSGQ